MRPFYNLEYYIKQSIVCTMRTWKSDSNIAENSNQFQLPFVELQFSDNLHNIWKVYGTIRTTMIPLHSEASKFRSNDYFNL